MPFFKKKKKYRMFYAMKGLKKGRWIRKEEEVVVVRVNVDG